MRLLNIILHLLLVLTVTARNSIDFVDGAQFSVEYTYVKIEDFIFHKKFASDLSSVTKTAQNIDYQHRS